MSKDIFSIGDYSQNNYVHQEDNTQYIEDSFLQGESIEENYLSSNFELTKLKSLFIFIIFTILCIVFRLGYLQIIKGSEYRLAAEENRIRIQEIKAPRGIIYDRNNTVLAQNVPNFILSFTPADLPNNNVEKKEITDEIANILEIDSIGLLNIINEQSVYSYQSFTLVDHISYEKAILLKIATADLPGISLDAISFREYLSSEYFSHIIGYMGKMSPADLESNINYSYDDFLGKMGIEQFYDEKLRGEHGKKQIEVDSLGKESQVINTFSSKPGQSIVLTIDEGLQNVLGKAIDDAVKNKQSITGAAAVALNPNNGEVLAIVSNPAFDNNAITLGLNSEEYREIKENPQKPLFNRAIAGEYPPGSIIKPLIALAALEEEIINENSTFLSTGGIKIDKWFFPDWKAGGHGITDVRKAIAESVNTFFYIIGGGHETFEGLGIDRITSYLESFGLNNFLGIDLAGEKAGFLPSKEWKEETKNERWYVGDTYHLSIGQGDILVTPLQIAAYTAAIANGGTLYQPHLVKYFTTTDKKIKNEVKPIAIRDNFITQYYYQVVKEGLHQAVLSGSSRALSDLNFSSAGKTGTAQFGSQGETHAWFTSFAPYENPEIVITVVVEGGGEGNVVALPIAKQGLAYWVSKL